MSPNEDIELKQALGEFGFEAPIPFDFQLVTNRGIVARERKVFPSDFLASIGDGRLARECASMRDVSQFPGVILEGKPFYSREGFLRDGKRDTRWTKVAIDNILRSIKYVEGCDIDWTDSIQDTVNCLRETQEYFDKAKHLSLRMRPRIESDWWLPSYEERYIYFLQGLPGIKVNRARAIAKVYSSPTALLSAIYDIELSETQIDKLVGIHGIGKSLATRITTFLTGSIDNDT